MINETLLTREHKWNAFTLKLAELLKDGDVTVIARDGTQITVIGLVEHIEHVHVFVGHNQWLGRCFWHIDGSYVDGRAGLDLIEITGVVKKQLDSKSE